MTEFLRGVSIAATVLAIAGIALTLYSSIADARRGDRRYPYPLLGQCFKSCDQKYTPYTRSHRRCISACYVKYSRR